MQTPETRDQKRARLEAAFPAWCQAVAKALNGNLKANDDRAHNTRWNSVILPEGPVISLHLNTWEDRVHVSGCWLTDCHGKQVYPRDCLRGDLAKDSSINVGCERAPEAAAKDIARRFIPSFLAQHAGLLEVVEGRKARAERIDANSKRIAKVLGVQHKTDNGRDESYERTLWPGPSISSLYTVAVRDDSVKFEITLPVAEAEQVLELVKRLQAARKAE